MPPVTRSLGQLHFEDLEPHRFEDLTRALIYDLRAWHKLEPTGRTGSDDGFDVRGWEAIASDTIGDDERADGEDESAPPIPDTRLWLIQCKREKAIGPALLVRYLEQIPADERRSLYGLIFAAACDFSKKARDAFRTKCLEFGLTEFYLWGKGDLEDMLVQPKNDHLLFAHFGISLTVRRRSFRSDVRARLAMKRKATKTFGKGKYLNAVAIFRDPEDDRYPYMADANGPYEQPLNWFARPIVEIDHEGLVVLYRDRMAYLADDGVSWDSLEAGDKAVPLEYENPWEHRDEWDVEQAKVRRATAFWEKIPEPNRARLRVRGWIPFDAILAIDEEGDSDIDVPQVFVKFGPHNHPFKHGVGRISAGERWTLNNPAHKIKFFPDELPDVEPPSPIPVPNE